MKTITIQRGMLPLLLALSAGGWGPGACESAPAAPDEPKPAAPKPSLDSITFAGSGCGEPGSAVVTSNPDTGATVLTFSRMSLTHPPGGSFQHLNCAVGFSVHGAPGWQLAATRVSLHGAAHLPAGASGTPRASLFFAGVPQPLDFHAKIDGPQEGPYHVDSGAVSPEAVVWSQCGADTLFNVNPSLNLQVSGDAQDASFTVEKVEVSILWRAC